MKKHFVKRIVSVLLAGAILVSSIPAVQTRAAYREDAQSIVYETETYQVTGKITNEWQNHYQGEIILENTGKEKIENWKLIFESQDEFENMWNAKIESHEGNTYTIKNCGYNQAVQPGEKVSIGFQAGYSQEKDMPESFRMPQYEVEELGEKCRLAFDVESKWKEGCIVKATLKNVSQEDIEDWKISWEMPLNYEINEIWNAGIGGREDRVYKLSYADHTAIIEAGKSITFGMKWTLPGDEEDIQLPENIRITQMRDCSLKMDEQWHREMIHANDQEVVKACKKGYQVKVGLLDSGVDYSDTLSVVERENFVETYDDSNILYDDLSGHGTAVAGIMGAKRENRDRKEEDEEAGEPEEEARFDGSFLTERDNCVSEGVPQEPPEGFTEPGADAAAADSEDLSPGEEEDLPAFHYADNYADHYAQIDGVNPNVRIYSARVLDEKNHAPIERVIQGIEWAADQGVDILNISWGTDRDDERLHRAVKSASDKGILIIAAAGNGEEIQYPARYKEVMAVGAVNGRGEKAEQSAEGREMEVVAPGENIASYGAFECLDSFSGTSMAAPQVTALAAMLWQRDLEKPAEFIRSLIDVTANHLGDEKAYGYGLIDCAYALQYYDDFEKEYSGQKKIAENVENLLETEEGIKNEKDITGCKQDEVAGSWVNVEHRELAGSNKDIKKGIVYPDQKASNLKGMNDNPYFHGYYTKDYILGYLFLMEQAGHYLKKGKWWKKGHFKLMFKNAKRYQEGKEALKDNGVSNRLYKKFRESMEYKGFWAEAKNKKERKRRAAFVYGMALHTLSDEFAHSAYGRIRPRKGEEKKEEDFLKWGRITHQKSEGKHTEYGKGKVRGRADDPEIVDLRYKSAQSVCNQVLNKIGMKKKKPRLKSYKGSIDEFRACRVKGFSSKLDEYLYNGYGLRNLSGYLGMHTVKSNSGEVLAKAGQADVGKIFDRTWNYEFVWVNVFDEQAKVEVFDAEGKRCRVVEKGKKKGFFAQIGGNYRIQVSGTDAPTGERYVVTKQYASNRTAQEILGEKAMEEARDRKSETNKNPVRLMCSVRRIEIGKEEVSRSVLRGRVNQTDTGDQPALSGAEIQLTDNNTGFVYPCTSDQSGMYEIAGLSPGVYNMSIRKPGYINLEVKVTVTSSDPVVYNPVLTPISDAYDGKGGARGTIVDAKTAEAVSDITLLFRRGVGVTNGDVVLTVHSDESGRYEAADLPAGYYTVRIVDRRQGEIKYTDSTMLVKIIGGSIIENQNGVVSGDLDSRQLRIVLTWGETPRDLDSHLVGTTADGQKAHMYYGQKVVYNSEGRVEFQLDVDDTTSFGPETTTIYHPESEDYEFYVHNYSRGSLKQLRNSGATVQVYRGNSALPWKTYYVPQQDGYYWNVFCYNAQTGEIIPHNYNSVDCESY